MAAAAASEIRIAVTQGPRAGISSSAISAVTSVVRVGRVLKGNALAVRDPGVSQQHLEFRFSSGRWSACDLGSSNGTLLNGEPIGEIPVAVKDGDCVKIGESTVIDVRIREESGVSDAGAGMRLTRAAAARAKTLEEGAEDEGEKGKPLPQAQERQPRGRAKRVQESSSCAKDGDNQEMVVATGCRKRKLEVVAEDEGVEDKVDALHEAEERPPRGRSRRTVKDKNTGADDERDQETNVAVVKGRGLRRRPVKKKEDEASRGELEDKEDPAVVGNRRLKRSVNMGDVEKSTEDRNVGEVSAVVPAKRRRAAKGQFNTVTNDDLDDVRPAVKAPGRKLRAMKAEPKEPAADVEVVGVKEQIVVDDVIDEERLVVEDSEVDEEMKERDARKKKANGVAGPTTDVAEDGELATEGGENGGEGDLVANDLATETEGHLLNGRKEQKFNVEKTNAPAIQLGVATARKMSAGEEDGRKLIEDLDKMTLREWFDRMECFLPWAISKVAEEMIAELRENARKFEEFLSSGICKK